MQKRSKADIAYEYIKNGIIEKRFFPGNSIIEDEVVEATGVSRTSVRKAMAVLQYEGILESKSTRGVAVTKHTLDDIEGTFRIREILELAAFEIAVSNITQDAIERMKKCNAELEKLSENFDIVKFVKYNKDFHREIANATNNRYFIKYLNEIYDNIAVYLLFYNSAVDDQRSVVFHNALIEALTEKNVVKGKSAIIADNGAGMEDTDLSSI